MSSSIQTTKNKAGQVRTSRWLEDRLGLSGISYAVPEHANSLPYLLGGMTLFGFLILIVTGIYLAQFYNPQPTAARDQLVRRVGTAGRHPGTGFHWVGT